MTAHYTPVSGGPEQTSDPRYLIRVIQLWATYILVVLLPFAVFQPLTDPLITGIFIPYVTPGIYLSDLAIVLSLVVVILTSSRVRWGPPEISIPLLGLGLLAILTAYLSLSPPLALYTSIRWLLAFAIYLCFVQRVVATERIIYLFLIGLSFQVVIGLAQVASRGPLGLPGEVAIPNTIELAWTFRASGMTFHPNVLGGFLVVGLILSIPLLSKWPVRVIHWLLWVGLISTFSRSAWVAALLLPLVLIWHFKYRPPLRPALMKTIVGIIIVISLSCGVWREQISVRLQPIQKQATAMLMRADSVSTGNLDPKLSSGDPNIDEARGASAVAISDRLMQVKLALAVIRERPLSGIGAGSFPLFMLQVGSPIIPNFVHNVPLLLAAEVGLLGAGLWLTIWIGASTLFIRLWRKADCWLVVTLCAGIALVIISLFDFYPWGLNSGRLLTAMVLGMFARALERAWSV